MWALMKATTQKYSNETELLKHILKYLIFKTKQNKTKHFTISWSILNALFLTPEDKKLGAIYV